MFIELNKSFEKPLSFFHHRGSFIPSLLKVPNILVLIFFDIHQLNVYIIRYKIGRYFSLFQKTTQHWYIPTLQASKVVAKWSRIPHGKIF
jgi:hypothetical protein